MFQVKAQAQTRKIENAKAKMQSSLAMVKAQSELLQTKSRLLLQFADRATNLEEKLRLQATARDLILNTQFGMNMDAWSELAGEFDDDDELEQPGTGNPLPELCDILHHAPFALGSNPP